mgnify:CR=1 FL=1
MKYKGKAYKFGDNVNTDEIIPAQYLYTKDPIMLGKHCLENTDKNFVRKVKKGDILVAGKNFGSGSSREHAPIAIKACGVSCVIAKSFARIFYRNAINIGLPIMESVDAADGINSGDKVELDTRSGKIRNISGKKEYTTEAFPVFIEKIIKKGGLLSHGKK